MQCASSPSALHPPATPQALSLPQRLKTAVYAELATTNDNFQEASTTIGNPNTNQGFAWIGGSEMVSDWLFLSIFENVIANLPCLILCRLSLLVPLLALGLWKYTVVPEILYLYRSLRSKVYKQWPSVHRCRSRYKSPKDDALQWQ